jgi:choloylglycine hydrolase
MGLLDIMEFPEADSRAPIHPFRWVQYQLDNCSTVDEVLASDQVIRIPQPSPDSKETMGAHYLVSDSKGKTAIIEWIEKKMVVHTGDTLPVKVLTNTTYDQSLEVLSNFKGFGGSWTIPPGLFWVYFSNDTHSYLRFIRAAEMVKDFDPKTSGSAIDYAFSSLRKVSMRPISGRSRWRSVYDPTNKRIYFNSFYDQEIRYFNTDAFDYSCTTPAKALDVNAKLSGDVTSSFVDYTQDMSRNMLEHTWPPLDKEVIEVIFTYPEQYTHCTE